MTKKQKIAKDKKALKAYEKKLKNTLVENLIGREIVSATDRKSRAAALGECALQAMEALKQLQEEKEKEKHPLVEGSLIWRITEQKIKDTDGKKGFEYKVMLSVYSAEQRFTDEDIRKELHETYLQFKAETTEMFGETTDEEYLEGEKKHGHGSAGTAGLQDADKGGN